MYDVSTTQSLHDIARLPPALSRAEIEHRLVSEGVEPSRARWLARLHRRGRWTGSLRRIGYTLAVIGTLGVIAAIVLPLAGYGWRIPWLYVFLPAYIVTFGVMAAFVRAFTNAARRLDLLRVDAIPHQLERMPRAARDAGSVRGIAVDSLLGFTMMASALIGAAMYPRIREWSLLRERGVETPGVITARREVHMPRATVRRIRYTFIADHKIVEGSQTVPRERYERTREGERITVTYLPQNAWMNLAASKRELTWRFLVANADVPFWVPLIFVGCVVLVFFVMRQTQRFILRIARDGPVVLAELTEVERMRVRYAYDTPAGRKEGMIPLNRTKLREPVSVGQKIAVLYDPDNPAKSLAAAALNDVVYDTDA